MSNLNKTYLLGYVVGWESNWGEELVYGSNPSWQGLHRNPQLHATPEAAEKAAKKYKQDVIASAVRAGVAYEHVNAYWRMYTYHSNEPKHAEEVGVIREIDMGKEECYRRHYV